MARPIKNNCDYFPHDRDMRNHRKIKSIRSKFGIQGYGIWVMVLEYLTGNDGNVFEYSDLEFELMAGDFGVSATEIRGVVDYCIILQLLFNVDGFIKSESLDERLAPVYAKRQNNKQLSSQQLRSRGKYVNNNTAVPGVSVAEMPQSKVNESKSNESKINNSKEAVTLELWSDERFIQELSMIHKGKDLKKAFDECWIYHTSGPAPPQQNWEWRQKLNTWLTNTKTDDRRFNQKTVNGTRSQFSGTGYSEKL